MKQIIMRKLTALLTVVTMAVGLPGLAQPVTLTGTNYTQNFDNLSGGLPGEWILYTTATASTLGTISTAFRPGPGTNAWADTAGGFKNFASTTNYAAGTNFLGTEGISIQSNAVNRAIGVRPVSATDAGNSFALKVANTTGLGKFILDVDMLLLNAQTRSNNWQLD